MKKIIYSGLALSATIMGIISTNASDTHRTVTNFKLIITPTTVSDVTLTTNWTLTQQDAQCVGFYHPCQLQSSLAAVTVTIAGKVRHLPNISLISGGILATPIPGDFVLNNNSLASYMATNEYLQ